MTVRGFHAQRRSSALVLVRKIIWSSVSSTDWLITVANFYSFLLLHGGMAVDAVPLYVPF